ncbi:hypothetical protein BgiBS90_017580 [Biomphalaria glabrata]|nr:hypothetical protein BgiBS90_017580 [Biomphalaria glabrata]
MRTKVDKSHKKVSEEKLRLSLPSPKVVLNASECARLLDGKGKTSVLLVEKEGRMVAATSLTPPPSVSSTVSSLPIGSEANLKVIDSVTSLSSTDSLKKSMEPETVAGSKSEDSNNSALKEEVPANANKVILKPPKKRRGLDKKFESSSQPLGILNNGDIPHETSPLRESVDVISSAVLRATDAQSKQELPQKVDFSQKHSVENLLQHQPSSSLSCTNSLLLTNYSHHALFDTRTHHLSQTAHPVPLTVNITSPSSSLSISQPDSYQSIAPYHLALAPPPSQLYSHSPFTSSAHGPNHLTLPYCVASSHTSQTVVFNANLNAQTSQAITFLNKQVSPNEHSPSVCMSLLATAATNSLTLSPNFQHLPEQEEPMNLSKSCKPAVGAITLQSQNSVSCNDSRTAEDVSVNIVSQHSPAQGETEPKELNTEQCNQDAPLVKKADLKKQKKKNSKAQKTGIIELQDLTQETHSPLHNGIDDVNSKALKSHDAIEINSLCSSNTAIASKIVFPDPKVSTDLSSKVLSPLSEEKEPMKTVSDLNETPGLSSVSDGNAVNAHSPKSSKTELDQSQDTLEEPTNTPTMSLTDDLLASNESISQTTDQSLTNETDPTKKSKRLPKKKAEIPMDEESSAHRRALYSETIDYVIANFVYIPEPVEDLVLTEEEEAAIKDQFEIQSETSIKAVVTIPEKKEEDSSVTLLCNQAHGQTQTDLSDSDSEPMPRLITPPKKRPIGMAAKSMAPRPRQEGKTNADRIDSILAFVVADVLNSTPPIESGLGDELLRQQKKIQEAQSIIQNSELVQNNNNKIGDNMLIQENKGVDSHNLDILVSKINKNNDDILLNVDKVNSDIKKVARVKKIRKKVNVPEKSSPPAKESLIDSEDIVKKDSDTVVKKKILQGTSDAVKEGDDNHIYHPSTAYSVDAMQVSDKDILITRVETSDIGESIASTSGGSEQDTPVHEPEIKYEMTSAEPNSAEKENQDTGLESGGDDNKPVKKYKKRLDFVKCAYCEHQARGRSALSRHMKKVHMLDVNMPYKCYKCDYGCTKMASLNRHLFTHGVFPCSRCSFVADERIKLGQHVMDQHKDKLDMKLCKVCNRYVKCDQVSIESHTETCEGPTPYKCSECEKEFKYASSLRVHYHTHFPDEPKKFKCDLCEYRTNYKANLHKHHKNMHASKDRDIQCPDCGKLFSTEDNMRRHRKVHTLARPFACEICKKTFKTTGALKGHHLIHTATRPYSCNIPGCNRNFRTPKFLKSHQEEFHRLVPKKFFCTVDGCNYSFFKRSHLKRHAITHTGERNFHCTWPGCSKSFRHADNLKVHFRSHTNEKPVQCHLCDFKCKQKNSLFWHKKKVHHIIDTSVCPKRSEVKSKVKEESENQIENPIPITGEGEKDESPVQTPAQEADDVSVKESSSTSVLDTSVSLNTSGESSIHTDSTEKNEKSMEAKEESLAESLPERIDEHSPKPLMKEQSISTQTPISRDPKDLYEFNSDNESEEETPGNFRRDKIARAILPPLPPPPKELLRKNELLEKKEKEKKEKAEKREQEKKEKAEKKEQEKKERIEKKEQEKKDKAEKKLLEKKEKEEKKFLEKKEKEEKKEQERKEKEEKKEQERKEKEEKKEQERKEKEEKKEQERKEKEQEKKDKTEKKILEKKVDKKKNAKKLSSEWKRSSMESRKSSVDSKRSSVEITTEEKVESPVDHKPKFPKAMKRKRSLSAAHRVVTTVNEEPEQTRPSRKKKGQPQNGEPSPNKDEQTPSPAKRKKMLNKKIEIQEETPPKTSPRAVTRRVLAPKAPMVSKGKKKGKLAPPKRKPSARLLAKQKATAKVNKVVKASKAPKIVPKKRVLRKRSAAKVVEADEEEEEEEDEEEAMRCPDKEVVECKPEEKKFSPRRKSEEVKKTEAKSKEEIEEQLPLATIRPHSPAYSEEMMLQGKASPYRDFSDADTVEGDNDPDGDDDDKVLEKITKPNSPVEEITPDLQDADDNKEKEALSEPDKEDEEESKSVPPPEDESSDDEVSNDIPLTPPRAPAPPPMESSEDEMEPEPLVPPFSVPGPNTPFSVPGPNTPFSVPPPTNLIQQHSVHSEEAPMSVVQSVPSMEIHSQGSVEMQQPLGSVEINHPLSVEMSHPHGSVEMHHSHGSVDMHHPHGSVEMHHPHGSVEMHHPHGSVEMHHPHGSVEMHHPHGSVEMHHPHGSVEIHHPHGSVEMHSRSASNDMPAHNSGEMRTPGSSEMVQPHVEMHSSLSHTEHLASVRTPDTIGREVKYDLPPLQDQNHTTDADKEFFDQYLKNLSAANNRAANGGLEPLSSGLRELEAMVGKSHQDLREMGSKSPISSLPSSVITSLESALPLLGPGDLRARMDVFDRHHESLYVRDTPSSLPRLSDHQSATPLPPNPAFDAFSSLNSLHPAASVGSGREGSYLRQPDNLFPTPPVPSNFMAEAMFQHQAMSGPFLPPQPSDRSSLSRIPDTSQLQSNSSSLLRRSSTMPGTDMYSSPTMPQTMPRNPFANAWATQDARPTHWQTPYMSRQANMTTPSSFFPSKGNYLTGREFMFDPSVRQSAERAMFPSLSTSQTQDTFQLERFDLSNYFPNAMTPYASSTGTLDYTRTAHTAAAKPFDERYRQSTAASAGIPDFRGLPPSTGSSDMFSGLPSVNSGFNLYASNPMSYHHPQHMTDNVNSAFLSHSTSAQHAMFERDYAAAAHRGLYPQNTPYSFIDDRQYGAPSKLSHTHPVTPSTVPQDRDLMSRSNEPQMQDPYRSVLYRY